MTADPGQGALRIRTVRGEYLVPRNHPDPTGLRDRLSRVFRDGVTTALTRHLAPMLDREDGLVFVRRLEISVDLDADRPAGELVRYWGARLASSLLRAVSSASSGADVVRFASSSQYLASFLVAAANGTAWQAWYYDSFAGLKALPTGAALRTALLDDPSSGIEALLQLTPAQRSLVTRALTPTDARRVLDGIAVGSTSAPEDELWLHCMQCSRNLRVMDPDRVALGDYLDVVASHPALAGVTLKRVCVAGSVLRHAWTEMAPKERLRLTRALLGRNQAELFRLLGVARAERVAILLRLQPDRRGQLVSLLDQPRPVAAERTAARFTPFGGGFLMLQELADLPLATATAGWPAPPSGDILAALRLLLLAQCMGRDTFGLVFADALWRDLMCVHPEMTAAATLEWVATVPASGWRDFLEALAAHRIADHDEVRCSVVGGIPHRLRVAYTHPRGEWLLLWNTSPEAAALRAAGLDDLLRRICPAGASATECPAPRTWAGDLAYLRFPSRCRLTRLAELALAAAAQGLLRRLAYRLPGYAGGSLLHVRRNFLTLRGSIEPRASHWAVTLTHPPLGVLLGLTGMDRQRVAIPWFSESPLQLYGSG